MPCLVVNVYVVDRVSLFFLFFFNYSLVGALLFCAALINIFPSLHEIGANMKNNFSSWGELNKIGIMDDENVADKADATKKLDERLQKFSDKLGFVDKYKAQTTRKLEL
jgi:hypothetical protein